MTTQPNAPLNATVHALTSLIRKRSLERRAAYLATVETQRTNRLARKRLSAANLAHGFAALPNGDKLKVVSEPVPMIGIVSSYSDVVSAHQPMNDYRPSSRMKFASTPLWRSSRAACLPCATA